MNNHNPEVLAVFPLPSAGERRLREVNLASRSVVLHCRAVISSKRMVMGDAD